MSKGTILVIEPDGDIRKMLEIYFTGQGYDIITLTNETQAWDFCLQKPDFILVNKILSDKIDLKNRLKNNDVLKHIPMLMLCNKDQRSSAIRDPEFGQDDMFTIPFDIEEVRLRIENDMEQAKK
ncbi:MAG: hypothetical protein AAFV93_01720 [Chloroflexota bacterium]